VATSRSFSLDDLMSRPTRVVESIHQCGWAWSSTGVAAAEVSVDGGTTYRPATLEPRRGWSWQWFSFPWRPTEPGERELSVRAVEAGGTGQPVDGARNAIHFVRIRVE
jgi:hypothetical protein